MRYGSVCSGIEAATVAWHPLGWLPQWFAEIEPFPSAVLAHRWPAVPNLGDFTRIGVDGASPPPIELLVGGTPCQSFSVAGLRGGLADDRGNLALEFLRLADRARPHWLVWENVPGVLSSNEGRDFGSILGGMVELGYGLAYRVLDAQYFGVPQRRRRVFVVGYLGDWRPAAAVLFERASLRGNPPPSRTAREEVAGPLGSSASGSGRRNDLDSNGAHIPDISRCLNAQAGGAGGTESRTPSSRIGADGFDASEDGTGRGTPLVAIRTSQTGANGHGLAEDDLSHTIDSTRGQAIAFSAKDHGSDAGETAPTLRAGGHSKSHANGGVMPAVAFGWQNSSHQGDDVRVETAPTLDKSKTPAVGRAATVRRLTPMECERLQGFPDGYSLVPFRGKPAFDDPRYKALGNSMAVPVMRWIGRRIAALSGPNASEGPKARDVEVSDPGVPK